MGPMLVAMMIGIFFSFAAISALIAVAVTVLTLSVVAVRRTYILGVYVLGSGVAGAAVTILIGLAMQWNIVGGLIMQRDWEGYIAWGSIGYGWSACAALVVGSLIQWLPWKKIVDSIHRMGIYFLRLVRLRGDHDLLADPVAPTGNKMGIIIHLTPETEQRLRIRASQRGETLELFLRELAEKEAASATAGSDQFAQGVEWLTHRSEEEIRAARERVLAASPPPREIPAGKTILDMVEGKWPGNETDAEIRDALAKMS